MLNSCSGLLQDCFNIGELDPSVFELHHLVGLELIDQAGNRFGTDANQLSDLTFFYGDVHYGVSIFVLISKALVKNQYEMQESGLHAHGHTPDIVVFCFHGVVVEVL